MLVKRLGALSPLLFLRRWCGAGVVLVAVVACSNHTPPPEFFASGYVADRGIVRLWRKDDAQNTTSLTTVYSPLQGNALVVTRYTFQQDKLREIQRNQLGTQKEDMRLRFAEDGTVSFMQRQLAERRESLSDDDVALYQFDAKRMLELSDVLRAGKVILKQGKWLEGQVQSCDGKVVRPDFDRDSREWIAQQKSHTARPLNVAWLEAPEGIQLLLVVEDDVCQWQPK
ncbi:DUF1481 domain-containing protein [Pectobacterium cacticida]|uniref:DUF1481 domain-containing protein n=1 Tax=Pectobacterium cacticida TaxID=69221 RepID=A0ABZ2GCE1_9GAMM|nr:DUF1481 domain-containing protein [Pectobacterium cacticida]UYX06502.1 DUF1481 domain-containing protein [Pectobacterium cacticida]